MRLYLDAVGLERKPQAQRLGRLNHSAAKGFPVHLGGGADVGVIVAHSTVHFGHQRHGSNGGAGFFKPHHHVANFFAHSRWAGSLAVGAAKHRHGGKAVRHFAQGGAQAVQARQQHIVAASLELQGVAGVVDVFTGAGKVHKFAGGLQLGLVGKLAFNPVLHSFYVMVGGFFKLFDGAGICGRKVLYQPQQKSLRLLRQRRKLRHTSAAQGNKPCHFNLHAGAHVAVFAHARAQWLELGGIASVEWRNGGKGGEVEFVLHGGILGVANAGSGRFTTIQGDS